MSSKPKFHRKLLFYGAIISFTAIFQMGYTNSYPNTANAALRRFFNNSLRIHSFSPSHSEVTWILAAWASTWFLGYAIGLMIAMPLADCWGRKIAILSGNIGNLFALLLKLVAVRLNLFELLFIGRFLVAIATGICSCPLVMFLEEISPIEIRATMGFYPTLAMFFANAVGTVVGMTTNVFSDLTMVLGIAAIPCVLSILVMLPFPETPKYLLLKRDDRFNAFRSLRFYQGDDCAAHRATLDMYERERECENDKHHRSLYFVLHTPYLRLALACGIIAKVVITPYWFLLLYSTVLLTELSVPFAQAQWTTAAAIIFCVVAAYVGMNIAAHYGRRLLFLGFTMVNTACLVLFAACAMMVTHFPDARDGCLVFLILYFVTFSKMGHFFSMATGPIAWFLPCELVQHDYRATIQSCSMFVGQIATLILTLLSIPAYVRYGPVSLLCLYVVPNVCALTFLYMYLPETFDKPTFEVVETLREVCKPKPPIVVARSRSLCEGEPIELPRPRQKRAASLFVPRADRRTSLFALPKPMIAKGKAKTSDKRRMSTVIEISPETLESDHDDDSSSH